MLRIAICDDMPPFLQQAKTIIAQWSTRPEELHLETFEDADSLLCAHNIKPFDLFCWT